MTDDFGLYKRHCGNFQLSTLRSEELKADSQLGSPCVGQCLLCWAAITACPVKIPGKGSQQCSALTPGRSFPPENARHIHQGRAWPLSLLAGM